VDEASADDSFRLFTAEICSPSRGVKNVKTAGQVPGRKVRMRFKPVFVSGLLVIALSGNAFGQPSLPWARSEQSKGLETEEVLESQLPLVRARIEGSSEVWVGQAVPLNVEVIVPSWFTGAPRFPELEVPNAVTLSPEAAVNFVVQSAGKTFSAQGRRYLIFPQAKGKYTVPSTKVEVTYAMPEGKSSGPKYLASPSLIFEAQLPAGAEGAKYFLTTKNFHIDQSLNRKLEGLKVGDSITRTVNMMAEDTVGMTLPPLSFEAPEGIRLYRGVSKISEKAERGRIEATRTETATYVLEKEGGYKVPEIVILWWDPEKKKMNNARLPAMEFQVRGNSDYNAEVFASSEEIEGKPADEPKRTVLDRLKASLHWVLAMLGVFLFFLVIWRILSVKGISFRPYLAERRTRRAEAEITYFKRFQKASLSNDARATLRELMFWLDHSNTQPEASTLEQFVRESGVPELLKEGDVLEGLLFARPAATGPSEFQGEWSGKAFNKLVAQARRAQIYRSKRLKQSGEQMLSLNPGF
jgi:hypothetical protein